MNSKKVIDVGVSSAMIELKAELMRAKSEVDSNARPSPPVKKSDLLKKSSKKFIPVGKNPGLEARVQKDLEKHSLEEKSLEKSQAALIAKAEIYERMKRTALEYDEKEHPILASALVDFQKKALENKKEEKEKWTKYEQIHNDGKDTGDYQVDEDEWTEFTDVLGRTRRCLKSDLASFEASNAELSRPKISPEEEARLKMHEKWEAETEELTEKSEVHYQDIRFDEVRTHGVSYYQFSKDNPTREEQIRGLKKMSAQTESDRSKIAEEKKERKRQLKERLRKVRQRKRAKLGLPLEEEKSDSSGDESKNAEPTETEIEPPEKPEFPPEIRAWDFGKPGVFGPRPSSFDELDAKWLKDRRADRNSEFAPPSLYSANFVRAKDSKPGPSGSSNTQRTYQPLPSRPPQIPKRISDELPAPAQEQPNRGLGVEIAPPPTFEYFHGGGRGHQTRPSRPDDATVANAISEGLKIIREKAERDAKMGNIDFT